MTTNLIELIFPILVTEMQVKHALVITVLIPQATTLT
jgi:hypothetical protein